MMYLFLLEIFLKLTIMTVTPAFPFALFVHLNEGYANEISTFYLKVCSILIQHADLGKLNL